jgi:hypothetical protein
MDNKRKIEIEEYKQNKKIKLSENELKKLELITSSLNESDELKIFCESLQNNEVHNKIKQLICNYLFMETSDAIYKKILSDIFYNKLFDFTINFKDNSSFSCLKILLMRISYFATIFQEYSFTHSITLDESPAIVIPLLKLLYKFDIQEITITNFLDIFYLMDKWLMEREYFTILIKLLNEKFILEIATSFGIECMIKFEYCLCNIHEKYKIAKRELLYIYSIYNCDDIFLFHNWQNKFSDYQKLNAIERSKKYELLDISNISPSYVIELLRKIDKYKMDIVYSSLLCNKSSNSAIYFNHTNNLPQKIQNVIIVKSYYPILKIILLVDTTIIFEEDTYKNNCKNDMLYCTHPYATISVGDTLLIGNNLDEISKNMNLYETIITMLDYNIGNDNISIMTFPHYIDKTNVTIHTSNIDDNIGKVWKVNEFTHTIVPI